MPEALLGDGAARAADAAARRAAQEVFDRPLVIEAGAGTGKTTVLTARLLVWCLGPGWEKAAVRLELPVSPADAAGCERIAAAVAAGVVAITFTEAAAAEMAERAAAELAALARGDRPQPWLAQDLLPAAGERRRRARALLSTLDHLTVRTIHAFCFALLTGHPLEAGVHPALTVDATGERLAELAYETVESCLVEGYGDPGEPHLLALAERGFGPPEVVEALIALVEAGAGPGDLAADPFAPAPWQAFVERLAGTVSRLHALLAPRLAGARRNLKASEVAGGLERLAAALAEGGTRSPAELAALCGECLDGTCLERLRTWGRKLNQAEEKLLGEAAAEVAKRAPALAALIEHAGSLDREFFDAGRRALAPLLAALTRELSRRGIATFGSLLAGAASLLAGNAAVRGRVAGGIDQLLVDEFQDTDRVQCELLRQLALAAPAGRRPGLFLVGDPKQSIYGWRDADLASYEGFVAEVVAAGGEVRALSVNFRSAPPILAEVARAVAPVMQARRGIQPGFVPLLPGETLAGAPGFDRGPWGPVEHWVSWARGSATEPGGARTRAAAAIELEAAAVAADIAELHGRFGVPFARCGLLLRSGGALDVYLEALRRQGVPFAVARDKQYYRRREIIDAAALVRAVLDPGDHLALLTLLRSPWVGVPDAALVPLWQAGLPRQMTELTAAEPARLARLQETVARAARAVPGDVPGLARIAGWETNLAAAIESLAVLRDRYLEEPADRFVERLRTLFQPEVTEAARYLGSYRLANLNRFFRQLEGAIEEGGGDASAVLRALRTSVREALEAEEGRPPAAGQEAVQVMTIHGAKGLDFDHVYLVQLHHQSPGGREAGRTEAARLAGEAGFELRLFGAPSPGFDRIVARRAEVEAAERVRTLYVAMTRARERLVLAGLWPAAPAALPPEVARTHLELLGSRPGLPDLTRAFAEAQASPAPAAPAALTDAAGVRFRFPALSAESAGLAVADADVSVLPTAEEVALEASVLALHRADALARQGRPVSAAASEEAHARLREEMAERRVEGPPVEAETAGGEEPRLSREETMAVGGAFHRVLETWDFAAPMAAEEERQRARIPAYLEALLPDGAEIERAAGQVRALFARFREGGLLDRFVGLGEGVLARELPLLLPAEGAEGPVGAVVGAIDLLYRDPASGRIVVADYKTDHVREPAELERRAATYAPQGQLYARAVEEALGLPETPRFELWFVQAGRVR